MSRKLWALLSALVLVAGLGFLTLAGSANASTGGTPYAWSWSVTPTACDSGSGTGSVKISGTDTGTNGWDSLVVGGPVVGNSNGTYHYLGKMKPGETKSATVSGLNAGPVTVFFSVGDSGSVVAQETKTTTVLACSAVPVTDATASVSVSKATCQEAGVATVSAEHASVQGVLDQSVGTHTAHFVADSGHAFAGGSTTKDVSYTIPGKLTGNQCGAHLTNVTPAAPVFTDKCGTANDTYMIPSTKGVSYEVNGTMKPAGTYKAAGTVAVRAVARKGYALVGVSSWSHTFTNRACGSTGNGNGNGSGNTGGSGNAHGGHHGHHGHHASHGHGSNPASSSTGSTGGNSTTSSTSGSDAPETGVSSEASTVNTLMGLGLIGVAVFGSGVLLWRRPWATK